MNTLPFTSSFVIPDSNPSITAQTLCPGDRPLVLMPVRLETRFFTLTGNVTELRVRVYPDKIHVDSHELDLTTAERTLGMQYWQQDWVAGNDNVARQTAWRALADRFGAPRAAWIARVLRPTNQVLRGQPSAVPVFPTLPPVGPNGESAWRHAAQARLLPDRWTAIVHSAGQAALSVTGNNIVLPLAVGPDPLAADPDAQTQAAIVAGDQMAMDPGMKWMVDFTAAENVGMGLRITIPQTVLTAGIDSLVVFGVAASLDAATSAARLADLFDAHHYTDGLEFLPFGTPTNNTDDRRSAHSSEDPDHTRSFGNEVLADPSNAPNATRVGSALGLTTDRIAPTFANIGQAALDHELDQRSMNTALWQVGWGYYLTNMMGAETGLTMASVDWARDYFQKYVRAGGPFPALRVGAQPYGILPVTSLHQWAGSAGEANAPQEAWLKALLENLRQNVWRPVLGNVARIGLRQGPPDPDADLADVMRTDGVSYGYLTRAALGRHYVEHVYAATATSFADYNQQLSQLLSTTPPRLLGQAGLLQQMAQPPHVAKLLYASWGREGIKAPLVQSGEVSPWVTLQPPNYIGALLNEKKIQTLIGMRPLPSATDGQTSLLQTLLRHSLLREIATAAARIAAPTQGNNLAALLRDLELVDLVNVPPTATTWPSPQATMHWRRQLALPMPGGAGTIGDFIEALATYTAPSVTALGDFRASLAHLQGLDVENLQLLLESTLDLSSHRLDAWITSFATKRLALMTANGPVGQYVGAYGWVENLNHVSIATPVPAAALPPNEQAPMFYLPKDTGFIHAPSLTHASTAALLRNAHLGPTGIPTANGPFAIDLSSQRAREASRLLDGVRQGQPLGALLGYRLERRLHDLNLDRFIQPLRNAAPLTMRQRENTTQQADTLAANNVVDGMVLLRRWQNPADNPVPAALQSKTATPGESGQVNAELTALADSLDALSDALTAEVAYQMARGNTSRMASTLSAIAQGDAPPPELEVTHMPRTGNAVTHRVMALFSGVSNAGGGWTGSSNPRPLQDRWLNAWVRALLGDARTMRCTVELLDATGAVTQTVKFPLNDVPFSPLDFVYAVQSPAQASDPSSLSVAEQMVLYHARSMTGGFGDQAILRLQHTRPTDLGATETTLFDALEQARAVRRLFEGTHGLRPDDIYPPERENLGAIDFVELEQRVVRGENALGSANKALVGFIANATTTLATDFRTAILAMANYGIGPAVPCSAVGDTPDIRAALARQAAALVKISQPRVDQALALRKNTPATEQHARCEQLLERGRNIYGREHLSLPTFTVDAACTLDLKNALAASTQQMGGDALAANSWLARTSRTRDMLSRFGACMLGAEVLGTATRLNLSVAQLPFVSTEQWVGLPPLPGSDLPQSKLSLTVQPLLPIDTSKPLCGLLFDEWVEVVPNKVETTALTFQYDPPNAFAPQSVLIAVPPVPGQAWTTETLRRVLVETLDLAKLRGAEPSLLGAAAQYLPALYIPFNVNDDAVSTDFLPLKP